MSTYSSEARSGTDVKIWWTKSRVSADLCLSGRGKFQYCFVFCAEFE